MRILLAEDDDLLGAGIKAGLAQHGFVVDWVRDGQAALREMLTDAYAAVVLDLGLPRKDGLGVLTEARHRGVTTPVLVLTARDALSARIAGLDSGADDYLIKPVDLLELCARLRALLRRANGQPSNTLRAGSIELDPAAHQVRIGGEVVELSRREFDLLQVLMRQPGRVWSREQLERQIYPWGEEVSSNAIEVHIYHLRRKLPAGVIATVRGVGYQFSAQDTTREGRAP